MENSTNIKKYKRLAPVYNLLMGNSFFLKARIRAFQLLNLKPDDRVLLAGVGTGIDIPLIPDYCSMTGIDISEAMLDKARKNYSDRRIELINMNAEELGFPDNSFDFVVLNLILSVVENPRQTMSEAIRVLTPKGKILVFDKFLLSQKKIGVVRRSINKISSFIGTDINRSFDDIIQGQSVRVILDEASVFRGNYRIIVLKQS